MILSNLRARAWQVAAILSAVLAVTAVVGWAFSGWRAAASDSRADAAEARAEGLARDLRDANATLAAERNHAKRLKAIGEQYERDKADAAAQYERDLADLRAGTLRLRKQWTCPAVPAVDPSVPGSDDGAELREQGAADIVRLAREADAQIKGLQSVIKADREMGLVK